MRNLYWILVALGCVLCGNFLWAASNTSTEDGSGLEGTWVIVSCEQQGEEFPAQLFENSEIQFADGKMTSKQFGKPVNVFTYKQDTKTNPQTLDFEGIEGADKGKKQLAIYELKDGQLKLCAGVDGKERPSAFRTEKGKDWVLFVLKPKK